jgi:putative transposase
MKKSRFSESQIVGILKEVELGAKVGETCRKHGVSGGDLLQMEEPVFGHDRAAPGTVA